jgi:PKD repeat protein
MYYAISSSRVFPGLHSDDIAGIQSIYALATVPNPPAAAFTATPRSGSAPLAVQFTDQSTGSPTSWSWSFGDSATSTQKNPSHTYQSPGSYPVSLTATNAGGSNTRTITSYIAAAGTITVSLPLTVAGWQLITLPGQPVNPNPAAVFDELPLAYLSGCLHRYISGVGYQAWWPTSPSAFGGPLQPGEGYWLYIHSPVTITYQAVCTFTEQQVHFAEAGWHLAGSPQTSNLPVASCTVHQGAASPVAFASQTGVWLADPLQSWDPVAWGYVSCGVQGGDLDTILRAGRGHWVYTFVPDVTLHVPGQ